MTDHHRLVGGSSGPETADRPVDGSLEPAAQLGRLHSRRKDRADGRAGRPKRRRQSDTDRLDGRRERTTVTPAHEVTVGIGDLVLATGRPIQQRGDAAHRTGAAGARTGSGRGLGLALESGQVNGPQDGVHGLRDGRRSGPGVEECCRGSPLDAGVAGEGTNEVDHGRGNACPHDGLGCDPVGQPLPQAADVRRGRRAR